MQVWFSNRRARLRKHLSSQQLAGLSSSMPAAAAMPAAASSYMNQYAAPPTDHSAVAAATAAAAYHCECLLLSGSWCSVLIIPSLIIIVATHICLQNNKFCLNWEGARIFSLFLLFLLLIAPAAVKDFTEFPHA